MAINFNCDSIFDDLLNILNMASIRSTSIVIISLLISILLKCCESTHDNVRGRESEHGRGRERVLVHEFEPGPLRKVTSESRRS